LLTMAYPKATGGDAAYSFGSLVIAMQVILLLLFAFVVKFEDATDPNLGQADWDEVDEHYPMYQDVHVMIFIGFGFLMTFLVKYSWSSVSYNLLVSCLCIQWGIVVDGFMRCAFDGRWGQITMAMESAVLGDFAAATILISFGGLLGRITPTQLLAMAFIEVVFYTLNERICLQEFQAVDIGGSIVIHTFGAYFGLAVSAVLGAPKGDLKKAEKLNSSAYNSDIFSMIGTVFLFIFWPSFNGILCTNDNFAKERVILNTLLALCGSCMMAFACSRLFEPSSKFNMVHIQNATLAGGVAVGASSNLILSPYVAILIGMIAGTVSTYGYVFISPWLELKGLRDTCGINNLHGMPGLIGGFATIACCRFTAASDYGNVSLIIPARGDGSTANEQAAYQAAALMTTFCIAILSGSITGKFLTTSFFHTETNAYSDKSHWLLESEQEEDEEGKQYFA